MWYDFFKLLFGSFNSTDSKSDELQKFITEKKDKLKDGLAHLDRSSELLRSTERSVTSSREDVKVLEALAKNSLTNDEAGARKLFDRLTSEKVELAQKESVYQSLVVSHTALKKQLDQFQSDLTALQTEADQANVRAKLADTRIDLTKFSSTSKNLINDLEVNAKVKERLADINEEANKPNEFEANKPNEFEAVADKQASDAAFEEWKKQQ